jgi:hypothetical protein
MLGRGCDRGLIEGFALERLLDTPGPERLSRHAGDADTSCLAHPPISP